MLGNALYYNHFCLFIMKYFSKEWIGTLCPLIVQSTEVEHAKKYSVFCFSFTRKHLRLKLYYHVQIFGFLKGLLYSSRSSDLAYQ